jgi:cytoskeletal protein RodZ
MPTVSEQLRRAREEQHLDIYQVAEITKIRTDHIRALESGNFDIFSAPVYIRGFVRTYGTMLKLDVAALLADLEAELGQTQKFSQPPPLTNEPRGPVDFLMLQLSRLNWRIVFAAAVVALFLVLGASLMRGRSRRAAETPPDLGPALYQPKTVHAGETLPLPGSTNK